MLKNKHQQYSASTSCPLLSVVPANQQKLSIKNLTALKYTNQIYTMKLLNSTVCAISSVMPLFPAISATAGSPRFIFLADIHLITYPPSSNSATPSRNQLLGGDAQFPWRFNPIIFVSWCIK